MKILIVEDDDLLKKGLYTGLTAEGYVCEIAINGYQAQQQIQHAQFSLIILDLGLPDCDGASLLKQWRTQHLNTPVLILTARDTLEDRIEGLDSGADDYLVKPFALSELLARIRAIIRRHQGIADNLIHYGTLQMDLKTQQVLLHDQPLNLSQKEFMVLSRLLLKAGQKVHRDVLQNDLYNWQSDPNSNVLEVYIHSLRRKIGKQMIQTIRGYGYQLALPSD